MQATKGLAGAALDTIALNREARVLARNGKPETRWTVFSVVHPKHKQVVCDAAGLSEDSLKLGGRCQPLAAVKPGHVASPVVPVRLPDGQSGAESVRRSGDGDPSRDGA